MFIGIVFVWKNWINTTDALIWKYVHVDNNKNNSKPVKMYHTIYMLLYISNTYIVCWT